jgi:hypothetical protein
LGKFHIRVIKKYADPRVYGVAVETGTLFGDSALRLSRHFPKVYTIEINRDLYERAAVRFKDRTAIQVLFGDSKLILKELAKDLRAPCLFYLDAHFSGDHSTDWKRSRWKGYRVDTGCSGDRPTAEHQVPLFEEIKLIHDLVRHKCLIYVDDMDQFDEGGAGLKNRKFEGEDWSHLNLNTIRSYLAGRLNSWVRLKRQLIIQLDEVPTPPSSPDE